MKRLYKFKLTQKVTEKVEEKSKDDEGNEITVSKDIEKKIDRHIFLRKPVRSLFDEAELYYGVRLSEGIKAGLLTRALLAKRFSNDGGVMSEDDKNEYSGLYLKLFENQNKIERLSVKESKKRTGEEQHTLWTYDSGQRSCPLPPGQDPKLWSIGFWVSVLRVCFVLLIVGIANSNLFKLIQHKTTFGNGRFQKSKNKKCLGTPQNQKSKLWRVQFSRSRIP